MCFTFVLRVIKAPTYHAINTENWKRESKIGKREYGCEEEMKREGKKENKSKLEEKKNGKGDSVNGKKIK